MKTSTFNRIFENARSVNIQSNEWFNYAGFFWMQCTEKQLAKMRMLLKAQGCKTTVKNGEEWYILNSGTLIKGYTEEGGGDDLHHGKAGTTSAAARWNHVGKCTSIRTDARAATSRKASWFTAARQRKRLPHIVRPTALSRSRVLLHQRRTKP